MAKKEKVYGTHLKVSTKRAGHRIGGTVGIFVFLLVLALFMALPIYLAVVMSLKPVQELFVFPPKLYVIDPTLSNYSAMFRLCRQLRFFRLHQSGKGSAGGQCGNIGEQRVLRL